jgi:hypothetical protein
VPKKEKTISILTFLLLPSIYRQIKMKIQRYGATKEIIKRYIHIKFLEPMTMIIFGRDPCDVRWGS